MGWSILVGLVIAGLITILFVLLTDRGYFPKQLLGSSFHHLGESGRGV